MAEHGIVVSPPPPAARVLSKKAPPKTADTHFHIFEFDGKVSSKSAKNVRPGAFDS